MKRKHLTTNFFSCDWTAVPLRNGTKFQLPVKRGEKWAKTGHYMNWQCVAAHAYHLSAAGVLNPALLTDTLQRINDEAGFEVAAAPPFEELQHFGGTMTIGAYKKLCAIRSDTLTAVLIRESGGAVETTLQPVDGSFDEAIRRAIGSTRFDEIELAKSKLGKDVHVVVLSNLQSKDGANTHVAPPVKGLGVALAGDVLVTCYKGSKASKMYANFGMDAFQAIMAQPKKRLLSAAVQPPTVMSGAMNKRQFDVLAEEMKKGLAAIDQDLLDQSAEQPKKRPKKQAAPKKLKTK